MNMFAKIDICKSTLREQAHQAIVAQFFSRVQQGLPFSLVVGRSRRNGRLRGWPPRDKLCVVFIIHSIVSLWEIIRPAIVNVCTKTDSPYSFIRMNYEIV